MNKPIITQTVVSFKEKSDAFRKEGTFRSFFLKKKEVSIVCVEERFRVFVLEKYAPPGFLYDGRLKTKISMLRFIGRLDGSGHVEPMKSPCIPILS